MADADGSRFKRVSNHPSSSSYDSLFLCLLILYFFVLGNVPYANATVHCAMESFYKPISGPSLVDLDNLPWDPAYRKRILDCHPNQRDEIRRKYWINEPCQPRGHKFPKRKMGSKEQHFSLTWFDNHDHVGNQGGRNVFSKEGFNSWNKPERLRSHEGDVSSAHNKALKRCEDLPNKKQSIITIFHKQDDIVKRANRLRLNATIDDCRLCLKNALSFRGHDESKTSLCKGNFLEI
ncbi:uncharacterized protein LOC143585076 [Bidens hawaiensis]|uniref:uncharacterized protein LOC143585076 n=1 Tax=Bidens hawaiensis TaxID=980011 RepID=UPI00404927FC